MYMFFNFDRAWCILKLFLCMGFLFFHRWHGRNETLASQRSRNATRRHATFEWQWNGLLSRERKSIVGRSVREPHYRVPLSALGGGGRHSEDDNGVRSNLSIFIYLLIAVSFSGYGFFLHELLLLLIVFFCYFLAGLKALLLYGETIKQFWWSLRVLPFIFFEVLVLAARPVHDHPGGTLKVVRAVIILIINRHSHH